MQKNRWKIKPLPEETVVEKLVKEIEIPEVIAQLLAQREIDTYEIAKKYFSPSTDHIHDPFLMKDMDKAVERILLAVENQENILVYGDYDVDGTTAVSLMYLFVKEQYQNVSYYIPDRYNEGYGVSQLGIEFANDNNFSLIITLDCGIKAHKQVAYAQTFGIDVIICDHHLPSETLPKAVAVLDPQRPDCHYPFKFLSGCGVGFKLIQALATKWNIAFEKVLTYLDLVAVSIAADIVPILDENRVLAHFGLKILQENPRPGLKVMLPENAVKVTISQVVFGLAPKINAAGRIEHASKSVELLTVESEIEARNIIYEITELNNQRRELDSTITEEALHQLETSQQQNFSTIVYHPSWHKGVLGIVASRLIETHYRPTLVFTEGKEETLVASARSVKHFDVYKALENCEDLLDQYGGHMYAAGLSMQKKNFDDFKLKFEETVKSTITKAQTIPELEIDLKVDFQQITDKVFRIISRMEPFGPLNMTPVFLTENLVCGGKIKIIGKTEEHLQFNAYHTESRTVFDVTAFNMADAYKKIKNGTFDLVYSLDENHWQGKVYYKLMAKDIKFHES